MIINDQASENAALPISKHLVCDNFGWSSLQVLISGKITAKLSKW